MDPNVLLYREMLQLQNVDNTADVDKHFLINQVTGLSDIISRFPSNTNPTNLYGISTTSIVGLNVDTILPLDGSNTIFISSQSLLIDVPNIILNGTVNTVIYENSYYPNMLYLNYDISSNSPIDSGANSGIIIKGISGDTSILLNTTLSSLNLKLPGMTQSSIIATLDLNNNLIVSGNTYVNSNITCSSLVYNNAYYSSITGVSFIEYANINNLLCTNITSGTLTSSSINSPSISCSGYLYSSSITSNSVMAGYITVFSDCTFNNLNTTNLNITENLTGNSAVLNNISLNSLTSNNILTSNISSDHLNSNNITSNILTCNSIFSNIGSISSITSNSIMTTYITCNTMDVINLQTTNITLNGYLYISKNTTIDNITSLGNISCNQLQVNGNSIVNGYVKTLDPVIFFSNIQGSTIKIDTKNSYSNSLYTIPIQGYYEIFCSILSDSNTTTGIILYNNLTSPSIIVNSNTTGILSDIYYGNQNDTISIYVDNINASGSIYIKMI